MLATINKGAFKFCLSLETLVVPPDVEQIDDCAFEGCSALRHVFFASHVTAFGPEAFANCTELNAISVPKGTKDFYDKVITPDFHPQIMEQDIGQIFNSLAFCYELGIRLPVSLLMATNLYRMAAELGCDEAWDNCQRLIDQYNSHIMNTTPPDTIRMEHKEMLKNRENEADE